MTPEQKSAALAALDATATAVTDAGAQLRAAIESATTVANGLDAAAVQLGEARAEVQQWMTDNDTGGGEQVVDVSPQALQVVGMPQAVRADWQAPDGAEQLFASFDWQADDLRGHASIDPGSHGATIKPADPGRDYQVTVAYVLADGNLGTPAVGTARPLPPPVAADWPKDGTWPERVAWIDAHAGAKADVERRIVGKDGFVPAGCRWTGSELYVEGGVALLENLVVPGRIRPSGPGPEITLRNVIGQDVFAVTGGYRVKLVEDCTFAAPPQLAASGWGQGALNAMAPGFTVRRTLITGTVDGMQCKGGGSVEDTVIRGLSFTATSHNDFIQNYGGLVKLRRCHFEINGAPANHLNGLFCDSGDYDVEDCALVVTAEPGTNAWCMHAAKAGHIDIRNSLVRGRTIGDIRWGPGVDRSTGY